jgi:hypothetical protein
LVFEDIDAEIECLKASENTCSTQCPTNFDPLTSDEGGTCVIAACDNRIPVDNSCYMSGDTIPCYSLSLLNECYSSCPQFTTSNVSVSNNPKCDVVPCDTRTPANQGACFITTYEGCYSYEGKCYSQCPGLTTPKPGDNVCCYLISYIFDF